MTHNAWHGETVRLRAIEPSDWTVFRDIWLDTEAAQRQWLVQLPRGDEAIRKWVEERSLATPGRESDEWHGIIEDPEGQAAGEVMTVNCNLRDGVFDYGVGLLSAYRGRGYAFDAARVLLRYYFEERRYGKAQCAVADFNEQSLRLQRRLGFREEGRRRAAFFTGGESFGEVIFGITAEEFAAIHGRSVLQ
ncbi:MAG: GNAT family N-acetyltransferase [Chloroflexi bacterium]|nr:GNAT family N-acetyltransferase [Chloroflexota bacterium]